ncbi:DUF6443 domain-containing protein [Marinifilum fragile]|uniref:DUF6443 domain-containing protein n=1 Tax=Marinifilum fragile TaxID=570161 RepID=UPI002AAC34CB|nr:DUF6443 domain-containing protein [Marinifilum fragile]
MKSTKMTYMVLFSLLTTALHAQINTYPHIEGFEGTSSWVNVTGDHLDWIKRSGGTPSGNTGPSAAYSGTYYYYLEASSPNYPSKTSYLKSSTYNLTGAIRANISFKYHMYGANIGSLRLESSTNGGSSWSTIKTITADQGNTWKGYSTNVNHLCGSSVIFRFIGSTGSGYAGDIALDDIRVTAVIGSGSSPSTDKNYVQTIVPQSNQGVSGPVMESITYVDGLGRTDQVIQVGASPNGNNLVQPVVYDAFGREAKKYLPFASNSSSREYYPNETEISNWTKHYGSIQDDYAYSETVFENSPLNRVLVQGAPGSDWQPTYSGGNPSFSGHTVKLEYTTNTSTEVLNFDVNNITKTSNIYYGANQLYKTITKDENWTSGKAHTTEEFKDKQGLVVLKRSWLNEGTEVNTYYVYDDFGLLRYVLPPKAFESGSTTITSTELAQLCYQYEYDHRKRMIKKVLPGALPVYLVYDERDRLVATQDGNMRNRKDAQNNPDPCWMFTKYDVLNRPVMTGLYASSKDQSNLQSEVNNTTTYPVASMFEEKGVSLYSYTNRSFPKNITSTDVLTVTYYDDYSASSGWGYAYAEPLGFSANTQAVSVKGMVTASQSKNLETGTWMREVFYYDKYGRLLQSYKKNHLGGYDRITNLYDFAGTILLTEQYHKRLSSSSPITIRERFEYDHAKRLKKVYHKINSQSEVLMVENKYDELGQLIEKNLHNNIQSVDYRYNIRGWLTSINNANLSNDGSLNNDSNDLFGMELSYNEYVSGLSSTSDEQFNGNISAVKWKNTSQSNIQAYLFSYDVLNRLKKADYKYNSGSWVNSSAYDVSGSSVYGNQIAYDLNGNILSLYRNNGSGSAIDKLAYQYTGNQLKSVEDAAGNDGFKELVSNSIEYTFDDNGNLIDDDNRDHEIQYNLLNLPKSLNGGALQYQYSATGEKLRKIFGSTTTDYIGNFVYVNNALAYIITSEGRIVKPGTTYLYEYNLKDHLGNTRTSFQANGSIPTVLQNQDYYPFGMAMNTIQNDNRYLYNGKELQDDVINGDNLDWYDYGARMYDPAIARWMVVDLLAELDYNFTPYHYCLNNPINLVDPDGLSTHTDSTGVVIAVYDDGNNGVYKHGELADNYATYEGETETYIDPETGETKTREKKRLSGGEKMGETEYWDEFRAHDNETGETKTSIQGGAKIMFGESWDLAITFNNFKANSMELDDVAFRSLPNGQFDIKSSKTYAQYGPATGKKLNGKYATARSAGNYLAGLNGATGKLKGSHISLGTYMRLAGGVHSGINFQGAPYYGEIPYAGRRIVAGFNAGVKKR